MQSFYEEAISCIWPFLEWDQSAYFAADQYNGQGVLTREIQEIDFSCQVMQMWL